ncbi:MAG: hypothetical protein AUK64_1871 [bacterium P201]|nr:MAG: hypothetical protein AUK64_1871 [bacterium P201]
MARNKYNELKKARKAKMQKLRLQHAMWGTLLVVLSLMIAYYCRWIYCKYAGNSLYDIQQDVCRFPCKRKYFWL